MANSTQAKSGNQASQQATAPDKNASSNDSAQEIALEDFSSFLMRKIGEKYRDGMEGLLDRFINVFDQLSRINQIALSMHKKAMKKDASDKQSADVDYQPEGFIYLEEMLTLLYNMMKEWQEAQVCLDCIYVEQFLATVLERIDYLNTSAAALETVSSHDTF